ncbi:MAG: STAS domain-containing protein [candidate division Zixibacteria bacterium]|nr:STAS domain-containing protein [candidate division Zixibacteria bacterium]
MEIEDTLTGDVAVLRLSGRLWGETDTAKLYTAVTRLSENGRHHIILDLADVPLLNSSGLGALIAAFKSVRKAGGQLVLIHTTPRIQHLLQVTKLHSLLKNFATLDLAVNFLKT